MITAVGARRPTAVRIARSSTSGSCSGTVTICTYSLATSLKRLSRSTSCWYAPPIADRLVCPTIATTGTWSSLASYSPFEQVDRARSGRRRAHPEPAGELRVPDRLERRHLLVPGLHEPRPVVGATPRREQAVDPVARVAEDGVDAPLPQAAQQVIGDRGCHDVLLVLVRVRRMLRRPIDAFLHMLRF